MNLVIRLLIFLVLEFYLTITGLDDIADYGEYIDERKHLKILGARQNQIERLKTI